MTVSKMTSRLQQEQCLEQEQKVLYNCIIASALKN